MFTTAYDIDVKINCLTAAQVADELGVSKRRVLALIEAKRLLATRVGSQYLVDPKDVEKVRVRPAGWPKGMPRGKKKKRKGKR